MGNPIAALPMPHILPQVQKWFLQRNGYPIDESYLGRICTKLRNNNGFNLFFVVFINSNT